MDKIESIWIKLTNFNNNHLFLGNVYCSAAIPLNMLRNLLVVQRTKLFYFLLKKLQNKLLIFHFIESKFTRQEELTLT